MFVFVCFTGLSYSDMATLCHKQLERQPNGSYVIYKHRVKTDEPACIPLMEIPLGILLKHIDPDKSKDSDLVFKMNSNQKMNDYLKEVGTICGIDKVLTTHIARHRILSFAL